MQVLTFCLIPGTHLPQLKGNSAVGWFYKVFFQVLNCIGGISGSGYKGGKETGGRWDDKYPFEYLLPLKKSSYSIQKKKLRNPVPKTSFELVTWSLHKPTAGEGFCLCKPPGTQTAVSGPKCMQLWILGASCLASRLGDSDVIPREAVGAWEGLWLTPGRDEQQLTSSGYWRTSATAIYLGNAVEVIPLPLPLLGQSPAIH